MSSVIDDAQPANKEMIKTNGVILKINGQYFMPYSYSESRGQEHIH
jgi:hypothetical protein